ncbi:MAG: hypothetical protein OXS29_16355 [bacterium]|nr:hypothetical protein [bacterium]MDE0288809.1 hypothetical protein [bacterium]MDE0438446.1 hypothetical protein [bacterium]
MKLRSSILLGTIAVFLLVPGAGPVMADDEEAPVEIIEISGNLDRTALDFVANRIDAAALAGAPAAIIQIDSGATLSPAVHHLVARIADPPLPLVVWVGPEPAVAFGGAAHLLAAAPVRAAAPGVRIGYTDPVVAGTHSPLGPGHPLAGYSDRVIEVDGPIEGLVDIVAPSLSNLMVELVGRTVPVRGQTRTLETVRITADGTVAVPTLFHEPGVVVRLLRIATGAEAAFFFLMVGLAVVAFEFYALGPGIGAAVAAVCLLISGYGLAVLPLRSWAVAVALLGIWLLTADFQRGRSGPLTAAGAVSMMIGGLFFTDAAPQIRQSWWIVLVIVASVTVFYIVGMRTVARARFSTPTVGRDHLVGERGTAITDFAPDGVVEVRSARWKASAHRESHLGPGDPVVVTAVDGPILEVEPAKPPRGQVDRATPTPVPEG